jgi:Carboxypeptidase regulatory-like domain
MPSAAAAARNLSQAGVITGLIRGPANIPLAGICVTATGPGGPRLARTISSGRYLIIGLRAGSYAVSFAACASPASYLTQQYASRVLVAGSGQPVVLAPVTLTPASPAGAIATERAYQRAHPALAAAEANKPPLISGTARTSSGKPVAGICVTALASAIVTVQGGVGQIQVGYYTQTGSAGRYTVPANAGFKGATWRVLFTNGCGNAGNYAPQWWHGAATNRAATTLRQRKASTTFADISASLTRGGSISGLVRAGSATAPGISGACVTAAGRGGQTGVYLVATTGSGGRYVLQGLGTGRYYVEFHPTCGGSGAEGDFVSRPYGDVFAKVNTTRTGISGFLLPGATVTGTVTSSAAGSPVVPGVCVTLIGANTELSATTGSTGRYSFGRLRPGSYDLSFAGGCGNSGSYAPQSFDGGSQFTVRVGATVTANATMLPGGTISGTVTSQQSGARLSQICVLPIPQQDTGEAPSPQALLSLVTFLVPGVHTNSAGTYQFANLAPGLYLVNFFQCGGSSYASGWFAPEDAPSPQWLSVTAGDVTAGVNATMPRAGRITGVITSTARRRLPNICVDANSANPISQLGRLVQVLTGGLGGGQSARDGSYAIAGLDPGSYTVSFNTCGGPWAAQSYKDKGPGRRATAITVRPARTTSGINAMLSSGEPVSGVVRSGISGKPLAGACVLAEAQSDIFENVTVTARSGRFTLRHMIAGTYVLAAIPCAGPLTLAVVFTTLRVPSGHVTPITVRLPRAGSLGGTVSVPAMPADAAGVCITASKASVGLVDTAYPDQAGKYTMQNLAPGTYQIQFTDCAPGVTGLAPGSVTARVTAGHDSTVGVTLQLDGAITGTVTSGTPSGPAIAGICAAAYASRSAAEPAAIAITGTDGSYQISFLPAGSYIVKFSTGCGASTTYATQWYKGATSAATAAPVVVSVGTPTASIDASLAP